MTTVPVVDMTDPQFVDALHEGLGAFGFVNLVGHGVPLALVDRCASAAQHVFALPLAAKRAHETPDDGRQRGYTAFGIEHAKDAAVADLKEFWHVGRDAAELPANRFPDEIPDFANAARALFGALDALALDCLAAIAQGLDLPREYFVDRVRNGNNVLRVIHYPPLHADAPAGAVRAAAHEDINLITLLPAATEPGLEIRTRNGQWLDVAPPPDAIVLDTGDMMQLVTQHRLPATTHRVVNPPTDANRPRYSLPFFVHPRPDVRLDAIDGSTEGPRAADFLTERLSATGVAS